MTRVPSIMIAAEVRTRCIKARVRTRADLDRGGRFMIEGSTGSTPRDWAGGPSMRISVAQISIGKDEWEPCRIAHLSIISASH